MTTSNIVGQLVAVTAIILAMAVTDDKGLEI